MVFRSPVVFPARLLIFNAGADANGRCFDGDWYCRLQRCLPPLFHNLPHAVLAATIIVAVLSLVDLGSLKRTWRF